MCIRDSTGTVDFQTSWLLPALKSRRHHRMWQVSCTHTNSYVYVVCYDVKWQHYSLKSCSCSWCSLSFLNSFNLPLSYYIIFVCINVIWMVMCMARQFLRYCKTLSISFERVNDSDHPLICPSYFPETQMIFSLSVVTAVCQLLINGYVMLWWSWEWGKYRQKALAAFTVLKMWNIQV